MENKRKHTGRESGMPLPEGLRLKEEYRASGTLKGRIMERAKRETPEIRHAALEHAGRPATGAGGASENCAEFHAMRKRTALAGRIKDGTAGCISAVLWLLPLQPQEYSCSSRCLP